MIRSIQRELCKVGSLKVSLFVFLSKDDRPGQQFRQQKPLRKYIGVTGMYVGFNFTPFILLDYTMSSGVYEKDHKMFLPVTNVPKLVRLFRNTLKAISDPQKHLYYIDGDTRRLSMYRVPDDEMKNYINTEYALAGSHIIRTVPTLVKDYQENLYEGATIYFDRTTNSVDLSHDEIFSLQYVLSSTDFFSLSQAMLASLGTMLDPAITKELDIETYKSADYMQRADLQRAQAQINQPVVQGGNNVFSGLKEVVPK